MASLNRCIRGKEEKPEQVLTRLVLASFLWENQFYIDGQSHAELLTKYVVLSKSEYVSDLAITARNQFGLRHTPLLLVRELARIGKLKANTLSDVIQRPDEMSEFLSIYWKDEKQPLSHQVRKGLANAFLKFNEYELAKWDKNSAAIKLRDVMFLTHPRPRNPQQELLFKKVADGTLETPDTWEVALSGGQNKRETFTRLLLENKLGALAFLRNLRNMYESGVDILPVAEHAKRVSLKNVLPFRFVAAAKAVPQYEAIIADMFQRSVQENNFPTLCGKTLVMVDVSRSMDDHLSSKSDLTRIDAASALAMFLKEVCENILITTFSSNLVKINGLKHGFSLIDAIHGSQPHSSTYLNRALKTINETEQYDRLIVITDEQFSDNTLANPKCSLPYIINVGAYKDANNINFSNWVEITGFSERIIDFIVEFEKC